MSHAIALVDEPAGLEFETPTKERRPGGWRRKYFHTEESDQAIEEAYRLAVGNSDRQAIKRAAVALGWPKRVLAYRAAELGLSRVKELDWSLDELAVLHEHAHLGVEAVRRALKAGGFQRSAAAVSLKRNRLDLVKTSRGFSGGELGKILGVDDHRIAEWIKRGWLVALKKESGRAAPANFIAREHVENFVLEHPEEYDLRRVNKWLFLELITRGGIVR